LPLDADRAAALEVDFIERATSRVEEPDRFPDPVSGGTLPGSAKRDEEYRPDLREDMRRALAAEGIHDPGLFERLPPGALRIWDVREGSWLRRKTVLVLSVGVVHPLGELARGSFGSPLPRTAAERFLVPTGEEGTPRAALVLSTSGWRETGDVPGEARDAVYLVEPAPGGGFRPTAGPTAELPACFALESDDELTTRVLDHVGRERAALVLSGIREGDVVERLGVPRALARRALEKAAREGEFLRLVRAGDEYVLRRS